MAKAMTARSSLNSRSKLRDVADVINALVETTCEFRRDGLDWNLFVSQSREDDEQFQRRLRAVRFVHRNFRDETAFTLGLRDATVNFPGLGDSRKIFIRDASEFGVRSF